MRLTHWLRSLASRTPRTPRRDRPAAGRRPTLEALEDRCLMAVLISGPAQVAAGVPYALNLTTNEAVTQWNVNWGDGTTQAVGGNPSSVGHTYTGGTAARSVTATALRADGTTATASLGNAGQFTDTFVTAGSGGMKGDENMVFGPNGNLYVSDRYTNSIHRFSGATGSYLGEFVAAGSGGMNSPFDLRFGPDGNLYVASEGTKSVLEYDGATGAFLRPFVPSGGGGLNYVTALAWGPDGNLYAMDDLYLRRYNGTTGAFMGNVVTDQAGNYNYIAFGPDGNLYVADWQDARVLRYNATTGTRLADAVSPGYGGLTAPIGLTFGPDGDLYLADQGSGRVLAYDIYTGNFLGSRTAGTSFTNAFDAVFGPDGSMYVSDGPSAANVSAGPAPSISRFTGPLTASVGTQLPVTVLGTTTTTNATAQTLPSKGATVSSTITVPTGGTIFDLSLTLNVKATYDHYLTVTLTSPAGTTVNLITRYELTGSNLTNTFLSDSAPLSLVAGSFTQTPTTPGAGVAPYTGSFHTATRGSLGTFAGQNPAGVWTLKVTYNPGSGQSGQLVNWSLTVARNASALQAAASLAAPVTQTVTRGQVQPLVAEAERRWEAAGVAPARLAGLHVQVADLGGKTLGLSSGNTILLDDDAAGWGWFVDPTPQNDSEFTTPGNQGEQNRMDLLTVLMHEMGHSLGLDHDAAGVMQESLAPGTRRLPTVAEVAMVGAVRVAAPASATPQIRMPVRNPSALWHRASDPFFDEMADGNLLAALSAFLEEEHHRR